METLTWTLVEVSEGQIDVVMIDDTYNAVRMTENTRMTSWHPSHDRLKAPLHREARGSTNEFVCTTDELRMILDGKSIQPKRQFVAMAEDSLERFRHVDFITACDQAEELSIFEVAQNGGGVFVEYDGAAHMLFNLVGDPLPVQIYFDYISEMMDNEHYDLRGVLNELEKRDDITVWSDGIIDIPYYNREEGCNKCIEFSWAPTTEDYHELWGWCLNAGSYPSCEFGNAIRALDMLNIEQYRKPPREYDY